MASNDMDKTATLQRFDQLYKERINFLSSSNSFLDTKGIQPRQIEEAFTTFTSAAKATVECLECLSQIHPFIAVALQPFKFIIKMDIGRRDNDQKVFLVIVCVKDLMNNFFDLSRIRDPSQLKDGFMTIAERLKPTVTKIAEDITECGSACDSYLKKNVLTARIVKSKIYEERFANFIAKFKFHRRNLTDLLLAYTALGVDTIHGDVNDFQNGLQDLKETTAETLALLRRVTAQSTRRDAEILKIINQNGIEKCLNDDTLFKDLAIRTGDLSMQSSITSAASGQRDTQQASMRDKLLKEIREDVDSSLREHMELFQRKLDLQHDAIIRTLQSGAYDRILDHDLQNIWKDMKWKGSVKARHFVLALHDYYNDPTRKAFYHSNGSLENIPSTSLSTSISDSQSPIFGLSMSTKNSDDEWALSYINPTYVQPILEAIDDDGTGFISVKEVNTFVRSRPNGWSLLHWLAFWALGWQTSVMDYRNKICAIIQDMYQTLEYVKIANRRLIDEYLFSPALTKVEILVRSLRPINERESSDAQLTRITTEYTSAEEQRMKSNLRKIRFELDTPATITLVTGEGRIERYLFPLIYLLLRQHLNFILIACRHVINREEMKTLSTSLSHIFDVVSYRIQNLEALFQQTNPAQVQARFENFAFGMFQLLRKESDINATENAFSQEVYVSYDNGDDDEEEEEETSTDQNPILKGAANLDPVALLKFDVEDGVQATTGFARDHLLFNDQTVHQLEGHWTAENLSNDALHNGDFTSRLSLHIDSDQGKLTGTDDEFHARHTVEGTVQAIENGYELTLTAYSSYYMGTGTFDKAEGVLTITWSDQWGRYRDHPDTRYKPLRYRRIPPFVVQYRYTPILLSEDPSRAHWDFLRSSILHFVRQRLRRGPFLQDRLRERLRFLKLSLRHFIVSANYSPQQPLDATEVRELDRLRLTLTPAEVQFYTEIALYQRRSEADHLGWTCNNCHKRIRKSRIICLECIASDYFQSFDLCINCVEKVPSRGPGNEFTHDARHDMIKVNFFLHIPFIMDTIQRARNLCNDLRREISLTAQMIGDNHPLQPDETGVANSEAEEPRRLATCAGCHQPIAIPCWVCLNCEIYVCLQCDAEERTLKDLPYHTMHHHLVRISRAVDSKLQEDGRARTGEATILDVQQRIINMEQKLSTSLSALDAKVEQRLSKVEEEVALRFSTLESLLHQIITQFSPSSNQDTNTTRKEE